MGRIKRDGCRGGNIAPVRHMGLLFGWVFVLAALGSGVAYGQTTATIEGTVVDTSGAVIPNAHIYALHTATSMSRSVRSDESGYYRIPSLPVGTYTLTVEAEGFSKTVLESLALRVDQIANIDVTMRVGQLEQAVTVQAQAPLVDTSSAAIGDVVENRQVEQLPLNGRHFLQLGHLVAGVISSPEGTTQGAHASVGGRIGFSVSGNRDAYNVFTLDGVNVVDRHYNTITVSPSVDAIQEFKIVANAYSARYGVLPGAQVDIVTKSGTNDVHGSVYEYFRNDVLDARNFFDDPNQDIPPFRQNQFGFSLGGPIKKDRAFLFGNYEGLRISQSLTLRTLLPTVEMRNGDFSGIDPSNGLPFPTIVDPNTGTPFPGNQVPVTQFHPLAAGILDLVPLPNLPNVSPGEFNHVAIGKRDVTNDHFGIRFDLQVNNANQLFVRYNDHDNDETEPFVLRFTPGIPPPEGFGDVRKERGQNLGFALTTTISPRAINEFRFGFNRQDADRRSENSDLGFLQSIGISRFGETDTGGVPFVIIPGFAQMGDSDNLQPNTRDNRSYQFRDDFTYIQGKFTHQWGGEYRLIHTEGVVATFPQGEFRFGNAQLGFGQVATGTGFTDFLLNRPRLSLVQLGTGLGKHRGDYLGLYYAGSFRVSPQFTLNLGLRYEFDAALRPRDGTMTSVLDTSKGVIVIGSSDCTLPPLDDPLTQSFISTFGTAFATNCDVGLPSSITPTDYKNFAPRFGFAWDVLNRSKLVVRGAYGVFNNLRERHYVTSSSRLGPPFAPTVVSFQNSLFAPIFTPLTYENVYSLGGPPDRPATDGGPSTGGTPSDVVDGYVQQWTLSLQSQLTDNFMVEATYVGSRGIRANGFIVSNQNFPNTPEARGGFPPDPRYGESFQEHSRGDSWYHGATLRAERRFSQGLTFSAGYTYSKSLDTVSTFTGGPTDSPVPMNSFDIAGNKGRSNFDMRHRFVVSYLYELPFGSGKPYLNQPGAASAILGDWQVGGVLTLQSGQPFTVGLISNVSGIGSSGADRPNCIADPSLPSGQRDPSQWFDTSAFTLPDLIVPPVGRPYRILGTCGRNILDAPGLKNFDLTLSKGIRIREGHRLSFRTEFFNLTNHPNFNIPDRFFGSGTFGRISSAKESRQIQFALRYEF